MRYEEQEHRRHGRFRREAPAWLDFRDAPGPCDATTLDLSREGASFQARQQVRPRTPVILRLMLDSQSPPIEAKAKVCWVAPRPGGVHEFGVRFLDLSEDEQARLGLYLTDTGETMH